MIELAAHAIEGPPLHAAVDEAGLSVPAGWPYEDPRFPPPAPSLHNGAWLDYTTGDVHPWWEPMIRPGWNGSTPTTWMFVAIAAV